ncbi:unnamed protein product, partial [Aphanomyces euteiches]
MVTSPRHRGRRILNLLWKNSLLLKASAWKIVVAVFLPAVVVYSLGFLQGTEQIVQVPDGWSEIDGERAISNNLFKKDKLSVPKYYTSESTFSALLLTLALNGWTNRHNAESATKIVNKICARAAFGGNVSINNTSPFTWPFECRDFVIPQKLAIVPDNEFTRHYFARFLSKWYPRVPLTKDESFVVPSFADSIMYFPDDAALSGYVSSKVYASDFTAPSILAAIVFSSTPALPGAIDDIHYTIRMDQSLSEHTETRDISAQKTIDTDSYQYYTTSGFMALQTLVTRFMACMPDPLSGNCLIAPPGKQSQSINAKLLDQFDQDLTLRRVASRYRKILRKSFDPLEDIPQTSMTTLLEPLYL